uniref:NADH dehydrogenase subunit 2 n=1 Tax=Macrostemum radiatum TaxID=1875683 RepID=UPI00223703B5|nr:NADH dehydrogenase subunit 2 [Macrostemum radiatum]UYO79396.1 NADH dehydrogenase subunit 2 [Macrostemum radiatum]
MFMNFSKIIFFILMIISTLMVISSKSWINCWISLEINLMFFIPLIHVKNNSLNNEFLMKFFFIQLVTSITLIISIMFMNLSSSSYFNNFTLIFNLTMLMKMGVAPFHLWMIQIIEYLSWMSFLIIMTWQKIAPLIMMSYLINYNLIMVFILINCLIGSFMGFNQLYMRKMLFFSSIHNMGWLLSTLILNLNIWLIFFSIYTFTMIILITSIYSININNMNQLFNFNLKNIKYINIIILLLSLSGLPPLIGFFPKWLILISFIKTNNFMIFIMMILTLINLYFYLRMFYPFLIMSKFYLKWSKISLYNNSSFLYQLCMFNMNIFLVFFPLIFLLI